MRSDSAKLTGYLFGWAEPLGLFIARSDGGFAQILANQPGFVQDVGEEYILEAGAMGADLELRMWAVGDARPELPQVTATDATYASGTNGLVALSRQDLPGDVSVTFDDVSFVPDPCPWDLDDSSTVSTSDLLALLANSGPCP